MDVMTHARKPEAPKAQDATSGSTPTAEAIRSELQMRLVSFAHRRSDTRRIRRLAYDRFA